MAIIDLKKGKPVPESAHEEPEYFSSQVAYARRYYRHRMSSELQNTNDAPYRVVAGGTETCLPGYRVEREDFPYWGIEFVSSGRGTVRLSGRRSLLKSGSVFAYGPGMPHCITADDVYPLKKNFVDFLPGNHPPQSFTFLKELLEGRVLHSHSPEALKRSFDDLAEFGPRQGRENDRICGLQVDLLLMKISEDSAESQLAESASYQSFRRCRDLIDNHFIEYEGIREVSAAANMDVSYLCRLFKRYSEETPYRRLSRLRMNHAAGLLIREGMSVSRTAQELGYEDAFTFSRRFKTVMGISPRDFTAEIGSADRRP